MEKFDARLKLQPISLRQVKIELKIASGTDFMAFLVKALFLWNKCSKNADISILTKFLAISLEFFSRYRKRACSVKIWPTKIDRILRIVVQTGANMGN